MVQAEEIKLGVFVGNCLVEPKNRTCIINVMNTTKDAMKIATPYVTLEKIPAEIENDATNVNLPALNIHYKQLTRSEALKQLIRVQHLNAE